MHPLPQHEYPRLSSLFYPSLRDSFGAELVNGDGKPYDATRACRRTRVSYIVLDHPRRDGAVGKGGHREEKKRESLVPF